MKRLTEQFVIDYFKDVDTMHPEKVTSYYGENGSFKFGNANAVIGPTGHIGGTHWVL